MIAAGWPMRPRWTRIALTRFSPALKTR